MYADQPSYGREPIGRRACCGMLHARKASRPIVSVASSDALPEHDFTSKRCSRGSPGQDIFYRVRFEEYRRNRHIGRNARSGISEPAAPARKFRGRRLRSQASYSQASISFVWSGDTAGPGLGHRSLAVACEPYKAMPRKPPSLSSIAAITSTPTVRCHTELKLRTGNTGGIS